MSVIMVDKVRDTTHRLLRWSEQYIKTDMVYLFSGGSWLFAGQVVSLAAGFTLSITFGNLVPKDVYGNYKYVFALAGLFSAFSLTTMGNAVTQAVARGLDGALVQGFRAYLWWSIPSVLITLGTAVYYLFHSNTEVGYALLIVAAFSPLLIAFNLYAAFLQGKKDFRRSEMYGFFMSTIPPLSLVTLVLLGLRSSVPVFFAVYYVSIVALSAYFHFRTLSIYKPHGATDPETTRYAMHLSLMNLPGRITSYVDKILVFHFLGAVPLAVYSFASAPTQYAMRFNGIFGTLALPKLAARDIPTLKKTLPRKMALHMAAAIAGTLVYVILAPYFFLFLFPQYIAAVPYSQVLGLTILTAPGVWLSQTLIAHMKKRELYLLNTLNPLIEIALYAALIPSMGLWGIIIAILVSGFFTFGLAGWIFLHLEGPALKS